MILVMSIIDVVRVLLEFTASKEEDDDLWYVDSPYEKPYEIIKTLTTGIMTAQSLTRIPYLFSYLLIMYPVIMENKRRLLLPWLFISAFRNLLLNLSLFLIGTYICSIPEKLILPCLTFTAIRACELSCYMFLWSSVHDLYYFLGRPTVDEGTIYTAEVRSASNNDVPCSVDEDGDFEKIDEKVDEDQENDEMQYIFNRLVDDAIISWFVDEICNEEYRQQSDNDYEAGLNDRVEEFLRLTSDEIIRRHFDRNMRKAELNTIIQNQGNRTQKIKKCLEYLRIDDPYDLADMISRRCSFRKKAFKAALKEEEEEEDEETMRDLEAEIEKELATEKELVKNTEVETGSNCNEEISENNTDETLKDESNEKKSNKECYQKREDPLRRFPYLLNDDFIKTRGVIETDILSEHKIEKESNEEELSEASTIIRVSNSGKVVRCRNVSVQTNKISRLWTKIFDGTFSLQEMRNRSYRM